MLNHKGKIQTFASAGTSAVGMMSVEKALATEFKKWISKGGVSLLRLQELVDVLTDTKTEQAPTPKTKKKHTKAVTKYHPHLCKNKNRCRNQLIVDRCRA